MTDSTIVIEGSGHAVVQDLGRPGFAEIGIPGNGAADQHSARTGNILVGNAEAAPLVEVTGSALAFRTDTDLLVAVTGAAETLQVDGSAQPAWQTLVIGRGSHVAVPASSSGLRTYVAINGRFRADSVLGSVAPDRLLGIGRQLVPNDTLAIATRYRSHPQGSYAPLFRFDAPRIALALPAVINVIAGPDIERMRLGKDVLSPLYEVTPQSDQIGLRLRGSAIEQLSADEILSRGVPVGAVEVPPSGGIIILLRGRLVTAGYPVIGVVTTESLDRLGQLRPGDLVDLRLVEAATAHAKLRERAQGRQLLAERVGAAFRSVGLEEALDPMHPSHPNSRLSTVGAARPPSDAA